jgi:hypothetical protein
MNRDGQPVSDNLAGVVVEAPTRATLVMVQAEFLRHLLITLVRRPATPPRPDPLAPDCIKSFTCNIEAEGGPIPLGNS